MRKLFGYLLIGFVLTIIFIGAAVVYGAVPTAFVFALSGILTWIAKIGIEMIIE